MIHRIASNPDYSSSLVEIESQWTFADILRAHYVIDAKERVERKAAAVREK